jgi:predicted CXXCH cytochrome family protein
LANKRGTRAVSQFEALAQSGCKRASGDKMTCTTCHDPHSSPEEAKKVEYYRSKCIACHGAAFAQKHHTENPNCIECHMPGLSAKDISHTQATDHRILRRPSSSGSSSQAFQPTLLEPFPTTAETQDDVRDLALAYEALAEAGDSSVAPEAERLLQETSQRDSNDAPVLAALGYIAQRRGDTDSASRYYEAALHNDPEADEAATNLGVLEAKAGHLRRSVSLWQSVFERAPWRSSVGIDIALGYCSAGRFDRAAAYVNRVLEFNPDFGVGRSLLAQLRGNPPGCSLQH